MSSMQEPENIEPVIDADDSDIAVPRQIAAIGDRAVCRTISKRAAMQPHHYGPLGAVPQAGRPEIQGQAILGFGRRVCGAEKRFENGAALRAVR